ncbi:hypothetical protein FKN04_22500 [Bacillus glycinifermentans]|uniref:hypothetical protein n=1 Tax=Bacillus glycinifermentans TaxID=1664069 RepID=UPI00158433AD|nr:hypothetical protein [Bacillus glycinifermentans]NUJ19306.1 hypothetical protein [Bacillus glycinifermentans]
MAYIRSLDADLKEGKIEFDIDLYDEPEKTKTVYARILEVLKDVGIENARGIFESRFGKEMDAKTAFQIASESRKRIKEDEFQKLYKVVIDQIDDAARKGYFKIAFDIPIGKLRLYKKLGESLYKKGFEFSTPSDLQIIVKWGPEETEDKKHDE